MFLFIALNDKKKEPNFQNNYLKKINLFCNFFLNSKIFLQIIFN